MKIHGGFSAQKVFEDNRQERRKCHAIGNQKGTEKETRKKARESAHRQGQLLYMRLVFSLSFHQPREELKNSPLISFRR